MGLGFCAPRDLRRRWAAANKGFMALFLRTTSATIALSPLEVDSYLRVCSYSLDDVLGTEFFQVIGGASRAIVRFGLVTE